LSSNRKAGPIRIGLIADEPIRLAGLASIFDLQAQDAPAHLIPVVGSIPELLSMATLKYLVVDLHSSDCGLKALERIRRVRPDIRSIVIGPAGDDELVLSSIVGGARAYLDLHEDPGMLRKAIEVVTEGSIWAPRRLLSKLIDDLLKAAPSSFAAKVPPLTARERQVLELILLAHSNREIARQLGIEERTVRAHLARLMRKAGVDNRIKLSMSARSLFQLPQEPVGLKNSRERVHRISTH
jgi:DNA-binding NarL/FixJ family response regulator